MRATPFFFFLTAVTPPASTSSLLLHPFIMPWMICPQMVQSLWALTTLTEWAMSWRWGAAAGARVGGMRRREEIRRVEEKNADKEGVSEGQDGVCTLFLGAFSPLSPVAFSVYLFSALYFTFYMHLRCSMGRMDAVYIQLHRKCWKFGKRKWRLTFSPCLLFS